MKPSELKHLMIQKRASSPEEAQRLTSEYYRKLKQKRWRKRFRVQPVEELKPPMRVICTIAEAIAFARERPER